jgi:hypothetical protein
MIIKDNKNRIKSQTVCVSGYWKINNKHGNKFDNWFNNTLHINCPYIFFCSKEMIDIIKKYRKDLPTYFIEYDIKDFVTQEYKNKMIVHKIHCPSLELNLVWNEKIFLLKKALEVNPYKSEFFVWVDAGISLYRDNHPPNKLFPNKEKIKLLPKDKIIYSSSYPYVEECVLLNNYYHSISGTSYMLHKNIINTIAVLYKEYMEKLVNKNNIWTDQVIWTHIFKDNKELFYEISNGYGKIIEELY